MAAPDEPIVRLDGLTHRYTATPALDDVTLAIPGGCLVGLIGPDGVGKSSLLGIVAGAKRIQAGSVEVLGGSMADARHRAEICPRIAFMPQGLGKNLYADLSVRENIEFFARLFGQDRAEREMRIANLLDSTGLTPFAERLARNLSGGMRQNLGLCCSLIHDPDLLILDEPTTGVDPLSRRQFWELIARMRQRRPDMSVMIATAYMEEAEQFDWLIVMHAGRVLAAGTPARLKQETGAQSIEDVFIALLPPEFKAGRRVLTIPPRSKTVCEPVIVARDLTRRFGAFTAVDHVNFEIERGELFGFLGSNGCGKTTTMKMLTGLLPATSGSAMLLGRPVDAGDMRSRMRVGYMSQSFSLYTELTVRQNLDLHARLFQLPSDKAANRIAELISRFGLADYVDQLAADLPLGIRQRLSLAVAVVHEPEVLILDEPTSGVDPLARDSFWELLIDLSRRQGVTIFVSTHFMNEAARCDRVSLMDAGRVLATDTPAGLVRARHAASLEDAFISYLEEANGSRADLALEAGKGTELIPAGPAVEPAQQLFSPRRMLAYTVRESLELIRDPIRLGFALLGTAFLMLIFGFGITTDVNSLTFAALDRDKTYESRAYLEELRGSPYFVEAPPITDAHDLQDRLKSGQVTATIEIPVGFGRDVKRGRPTEVERLDRRRHAVPRRDDPRLSRRRAPAVPLRSCHSWKGGGRPAARADRGPLSLQPGFRQHLRHGPIDHRDAARAHPGDPDGARHRAREGARLHHQPLRHAGHAPRVPARQAAPLYRGGDGELLHSAADGDLHLQGSAEGQLPHAGDRRARLRHATTAYGMVISAFTRTQIAALFGTAILTVLPAQMFAGMMTPVSSLTGMGAVMGRLFPMTYFLPISVGTFTKGLGFFDLVGYLGQLALFVPALTLLSLLLLRKQEK